MPSKRRGPTIRLRKSGQRSPIKAEPDTDIKMESDDEMKLDVKSEPYPNIKTEPGEETKINIRSESKPNLKLETKQEVLDFNQVVQQDLGPEVEEVLTPSVRASPRPDVMHFFDAAEEREYLRKWRSPEEQERHRKRKEEAQPMTLFIGLLDPSIPYCIAEMVKAGRPAHVLADRFGPLGAKLRELRVDPELIKKYVTFSKSEVTYWKEMWRRFADGRPEWIYAYVDTVVFATMDEESPGRYTPFEEHEEWPKTVGLDPFETYEDVYNKHDSASVFGNIIDYAFSRKYGKSLGSPFGPVICQMSLAPHSLDDPFMDHDLINQWSERKNIRQDHPRDGRSRVGPGPDPTMVIARPWYRPNGSTVPYDPLLEKVNAGPHMVSWMDPESVGKWLFTNVVQRDRTKDFSDAGENFVEDGNFVQVIPALGDERHENTWRCATLYQTWWAPDQCRGKHFFCTSDLVVDGLRSKANSGKSFQN